MQTAISKPTLPAGGGSVGGYWSQLQPVDGLQAREFKLPSHNAFLSELAKLRRSHAYLSDRSWWEEVDHGHGQICYHLVLGPKQVKCVRVENRGSKQIYKVALHWVDHCPFNGRGRGGGMGKKKQEAANLTNLTDEEAGSTPVPTKTKKEATNTCGCGCGTLCKGVFAPGHDARLKSRFNKATPEEAATMDPWMQAAYHNYKSGMKISDAVTQAVAND
jgi:hypothetical protein